MLATSHRLLALVVVLHAAAAGEDLPAAAADDDDDADLESAAVLNPHNFPIIKSSTDSYPVRRLGRNETEVWGGVLPPKLLRRVQTFFTEFAALPCVVYHPMTF